ncbi:LamG domain-containing protein [Azospirillum agricola]|uniref:LamG domain-containing protein n=1 Tax=Azospirillum agricola TaxID=1720247 RepID=UPI000A0EFCD2|nr:LamG domain-containing protein [Azospirillum agricola]SMH29792.1 hypothetical protein SAMN02982994_0227 [Azospirillum lipoferum]
MLMLSSVGYGGSTDRASNGQDPYRAYTRTIVQPMASDGVPVDDGPNNEVITTGTAFSFGSSVWSGYKSLTFPGNPAYWLAWAATSNFTFTGDYCFEWVGKITSLAADQATFARYGGAAEYLDVLRTTGSYETTTYNPGGLAVNAPAGTLVVNQNVHIIKQRDGTNLRLYKNGTLVNSAAGATGMTNGAAIPYFGILDTGTLGIPLFAEICAIRMTAHNRGISGSTAPNALVDGPFPIL